MIIKLHGTSGAGKSTLARAIMDAGRVWTVTTNAAPIAYRVEIPDMKNNIFILGKYNSQCGGCDTLSAKEQIEQLRFFAPHGHVFYEGLLASEYYGKLGEASEQYGDDHVFAFLMTPIEVCIERIKARRLEKGNNKPLNEDNTRGRVKKIERLKWKLENVYKRPTILLNWQDPLPEIMTMYKLHD